MFKRFLIIFITLTMLFSISSTVMAAEDPNYNFSIYSENYEISPCGNFGGYGQVVTGTSSGSFTVVVTGSPGLTAGVTISTTCNDSDSWVYLSISKPNGSTLLNSTTLKGTQEKKLNIVFPSAGTYTVHYQAFTPSDTIHIQCWIYG